MNNKLINKAITISERTDKQTQYGSMAKIKDEKGLTYTVYETKKDGSTSIAWEQLQSLQIGDIVQIGYTEQQKEYQGKPYLARTIRSFNKDIGNGMMNAASQEKSPLKIENTVPQDKMGLRLAIHGMVNGMLASGNTPKEVSIALPELFDLEEDIERRLQKPVSMNVAESKIEAFSDGTPPLQDELPTIQQNNDLSVEDIPF